MYSQYSGKASGVSGIEEEIATLNDKYKKEYEALRQKRISGIQGRQAAAPNENPFVQGVRQGDARIEEFLNFENLSLSKLGEAYASFIKAQEIVGKIEPSNEMTSKYVQAMKAKQNPPAPQQSAPAVAVPAQEVQAKTTTQTNDTPKQTKDANKQS